MVLLCDNTRQVIEKILVAAAVNAREKNKSGPAALPLVYVYKPRANDEEIIIKPAGARARTHIAHRGGTHTRSSW